MGDLGPFAILALVWWVFSAVMEAKKRQGRRPGGPQPRPPVVRRPPPVESLPPARSGAGDPSQREGSRLEQILREFEQALEQTTTVPAPTETRGSWDAAEEVEERAAYDDYEPEVESLEGLENFERPEREEVAIGGDQDALYQSRLAYAEVRAKALSKSDHAAFDARIRAPQTVQRVQDDKKTTIRTRELRKAMIWREVLGPPVALRGMGERD